jgi:hypothetical protein
MKKLIAAIAVVAATALPASATPFEIINPGEPMIVLPAFKNLGASRLSTIEWCSEVVGKTYDELITDSDFESYEACLVEHT